jgi:hypothetical protein
MFFNMIPVAESKAACPAVVLLDLQGRICAVHGQASVHKMRAVYGL